MTLRFQYTVAWLLILVSTSSAPALMTDSNLFAALNLDYPGLAAVKASVLVTNYVAAKSNLTSYLKVRTNVNWSYDWHYPTTAVSFNRTSADQATNGTVSLVGYTYTFPGGDIDWWYNYTTNLACGCVKNNEWQWTLNRMGWWQNLGSTYWGTRDESYALAWSRQLRDWIASCPVATNRDNGAPSTWRTIESGLRMSGAWPDTFFRFVLSPSLTNEEHVLYLKSCVEHGRYLTNFYTNPSIAPANFLTMEMNGLYTIGIVFPELNEATGWRTFAAAKLKAEETNQFLPDGAQNELTPRYHGVALGNILAISSLAATNNLGGELPAGYVAGMEQSFDYYARISTPQRVTPAFNDASRENVKSWLTTALNYFPSRTDFQWFASGGATGVPPTYVSFRFPWAGYGVMRSGWETAASYLCLDAGALGISGHRHEDKLNVVLWGYGREFLLDNGGGPYDSSIWRTWGQSTYSHNTVIVDSLDQEGGDGSVTSTDADYIAQAPIDLRWESDLGHDFAAGTYNRGYGGNYNTRPASQTRRVLFVKPDIFLIADTLVPTNTASHKYEARWHLRVTNTAYFASTKTVTTTDAGLPNLTIVPCLGASLVATNISRQTSISGPGVTNLAEILGWDLPDTTSTVLPATTVTHTLSGTSTQQFLTLFLPLPVGVTNPVALVSNTGPTSADIWLNDGRKLRLSADPNPTRGLRLIELLANGATNRIAGGGFTPPTISSIADQATSPNTPVGPIAFTVGETNLPPTNLIVFAQSLNARLVASSGIALGGSGSNRIVTVTPVAGRGGTGTIVLTVIDTNGATATTSFAVNVLPPTPTIYYWDTSTNAGLQPASGTWSDINATWSATNTGSNPLLTWPALGNDASFIGVGGNYSVTVTATQNVNNLTFTNGAFTVGGGALNHFAGPMLVAAHSNAVLNLPVAADTDFVKLGVATLTLGGSVDFSGDTYVNSGVLQLTSSNLLPGTAGIFLGTNDTVGQLDLSAASQTFDTLTGMSTNSSVTNVITIGTGQTLKITGPVTVGADNGVVSTTRMRISGGGALVVSNAQQNFVVGLSVANANTTTNGNNASLDCSKLGSVTLGTANAPLGELRVGYGNGSGSTSHTLTLSDTNNLITAGNVQIANSMAVNGSSGTLILGAGTNILVTDTLNIGISKVNGTVKFASQTAGSPGTVSISGRTGAATDIWIGFKSGTGTAANPTSTLDLRGHVANIAADSLGIGIEDGSSTGGDNGSLYFDGGAFTVSNIIIGSKSGTSTGTANGTLNIGGGTFTVMPGGTFTLGYQTNTSTATATLNLTGGTLNCQTDILNGGGTNTSSLTVNGGTLNLFGHKLGSTPNINVLNLQSGTLQNVAEINAGSPLVKTGTGLLTLGGTNGLTGGTVVMAGTLQLAGNLASGLTVSNGVLTGSGTIGGNSTFTPAAAFQPHLNGYQPGSTYDQLVVTGTVALAGSLSLSISNTNLLPWGYTFTIIRNDGAQPVSGTFAGLPQLATFTNASLAWRINYQGGDGNDVTVTLLCSPPELSAISNQMVMAGATMGVTNKAVDPGNPPQRLLFGLATAPPGATINSSNGVIAWRPTIAQAGTSNFFTVVVTQGGWLTNIAPIADAYVRDGSFAGSNFGSDINLVVKLSASAGFRRESYLKFDLSNVVGGIQDATLQLQTLAANTPGTHAVALVANNAWAESTVVWTNKPNAGVPVATWVPQVGATAVAPVTMLAQAAVGTDRLLSLSVFATNSTSDGTVTYGSRESGATAPALVLTTTNGSSLSATQSFWALVTSPARPVVQDGKLTNGIWSMAVNGPFGPDYVIEASTNLIDWSVQFLTNSPVLPFTWLDPEAQPAPVKFYRVKLGP